MNGFRTVVVFLKNLIQLNKDFDLVEAKALEDFGWPQFASWWEKDQP